VSEVSLLLLREDFLEKFEDDDRGGLVGVGFFVEEPRSEPFLELLSFGGARLAGANSNSSTSPPPAELLRGRLILCVGDKKGQQQL
jgi:hypothetical protein